MTDRIIDISESSAFLKIRNHLLVIERPDNPEYTLPVTDLAALVISSRAVTMTQAVPASIAAAGGTMIVCDEKHLPVGMMLPLQPHHLQTERFIRQAEAPLPVGKKLWQQIVQAKIRHQATLLSLARGQDGGLPALSRLVRSGDPDNVEARAARIYWKKLFPEISDFHRERFGDDCNPLLNYGYAILRSITARAVCAAGLHPTLGINHHNRYNPFCLADDLMEPFRPLVDRAVLAISPSGAFSGEMNKEVKSMLIKALLCRVCLNGEAVTVFDALSRAASSLVGAFEGKNRTVILPENIFISPES